MRGNNKLTSIKSIYRFIKTSTIVQAMKAPTIAIGIVINIKTNSLGFFINTY